MAKQPKYNLSVKIKDKYYKGALWESDADRKHVMSGNIEYGDEKLRVYVYENTLKDQTPKTGSNEDVPF